MLVWSVELPAKAPWTGLCDRLHLRAFAELATSSLTERSYGAVPDEIAPFGLYLFAAAAMRVSFARGRRRHQGLPWGPRM